jgi:subtilisin family serine protease
VLSTYRNGSYAKLSGTSMAAPFVSGVTALLLSKHRDAGGATPVATSKQLIEHLLRTTTDAGPAGKDPHYGFGLINPDSVLRGTSGDDLPQPGIWVFIPGGKVTS